MRKKVSVSKSKSYRETDDQNDVLGSPFGRKTIPTPDKIKSKNAQDRLHEERRHRLGSETFKSQERYGYTRLNQVGKVDNSCFIISAIIGIASLPYFHTGRFLEVMPSNGPWH